MENLHFRRFFSFHIQNWWFERSLLYTHTLSVCHKKRYFLFMKFPTRDCVIQKCLFLISAFESRVDKKLPPMKLCINVYIHVNPNKCCACPFSARTVQIIPIFKMSLLTQIISIIAYEQNPALNVYAGKSSTA